MSSLTLAVPTRDGVRMPERSSDGKLGTAAVAGFRREEARALESDERTEQQKGALAELHAWAASFTPEPPTRPSKPSSTALGPRLFAAERRSNNVACIEAGRGLGKTSVLVTFLSELRTSLENPPAMGKPTLVPLRTTDFDAITREVSVALALLEPLFSIAATVRAQCLSPDASPWVAASSPWDSREPKSAIAERNLQHALAHWFAGVNATSHAKTREEIVGLVREVDGNPLHVQRAFQEYVDQLACDLHEMPGGPRNPVFVASIDDADLSPDRIGDLLSALRIFTHERVAWVVSADLGRMRADLAIADAKTVSEPERLAYQAVEKVFGKTIPLRPLSAADVAVVVRGSRRLRGDVRAVLARAADWSACLPDSLRSLVDILGLLTSENMIAELARVFRERAAPETAKRWEAVIEVLADPAGVADSALWWEALEEAGVGVRVRLGSRVAAAFPPWAGASAAVYASAALRAVHIPRRRTTSKRSFVLGPLLPRALEQLAMEVLRRACDGGGRAASTAVRHAIGREPLVRYDDKRTPRAPFRDAWIVQASSPAECQGFMARWSEAIAGALAGSSRELTFAELVGAYARACDGATSHPGQLTALADGALVRVRELLHPLFGVASADAERIALALPEPRSTDAAVDRVFSLPRTVSEARDTWIDNRLRDLGAQRYGLAVHWDDGYKRALPALLGACLWPAAVGRRSSLGDYIVHRLTLPNGGELGGDMLHLVARPLARALVAVEERGPRRGDDRFWKVDPTGAWQELRATLEPRVAREADDFPTDLGWARAVVPPETIAEQASDGGLRYHDLHPTRRSVSATLFGRRDFPDAYSLLRTADLDWGRGRARIEPKTRDHIAPEGWHLRLLMLVAAGPPRIQVAALSSGRRVPLPFPGGLDAVDEALLAQQLHALGVSTRQVSGGYEPTGLWSAYVCSAWTAMLEVLVDDRPPQERTLAVPAAHALGSIGNVATPTFTYRDTFNKAHQRTATWLHAAPLLLLPEFGLTPVAATAWSVGGAMTHARESGLRATHYRHAAQVLRARNGLPNVTSSTNDPWNSFLARLGDA